MVVVKTEDEACGGPLRFYPLRPDELIDAGNRTKLLDVLVSPAIDCESRLCPLCRRRNRVPFIWLFVFLFLSLPDDPSFRVWFLFLTACSWCVCEGHVVLPGHLPLLLPAHAAGGLCWEQAVSATYLVVQYNWGISLSNAGSQPVGGFQTTLQQLRDSVSVLCVCVPRMNRKRELFQIPADMSPAETGNSATTWTAFSTHYGLFGQMYPAIVMRRLPVTSFLLCALGPVCLHWTCVFHSRCPLLTRCSLPTWKERRWYDDTIIYLFI